MSSGDIGGWRPEGPGHAWHGRAQQVDILGVDDNNIEVGCGDEGCAAMARAEHGPVAYHLADTLAGYFSPVYAHRDLPACDDKGVGAEVALVTEDLAGRDVAFVTQAGDLIELNRAELGERLHCSQDVALGAGLIGHVRDGALVRW